MKNINFAEFIIIIDTNIRKLFTFFWHVQLYVAKSRVENLSELAEKCCFYRNFSEWDLSSLC